MKYIVTEDENGIKEIFTFPRSDSHDCMAEVLSFIKNHKQTGWKRIHRDPVSAGFVNIDGECFGRSESLNLKSSPDEDTALFEETFNEFSY